MMTWAKVGSRLSRVWDEGDKVTSGCFCFVVVVMAVFVVVAAVVVVVVTIVVFNYR